MSDLYLTKYIAELEGLKLLQKFKGIFKQKFIEHPVHFLIQYSLLKLYAKNV